MSFKFEVFIINNFFYFHSNDALLYSGMYMWISYYWNSFHFCIFKFHHSWFVICNFLLFHLLLVQFCFLLWHVLFDVLSWFTRILFFFLYMLSGLFLVFKYFLACKLQYMICWEDSSITTCTFIGDASKSIRGRTGNRSSEAKEKTRKTWFLGKQWLSVWPRDFTSAIERGERKERERDK